MQIPVLSPDVKKKKREARDGTTMDSHGPLYCLHRHAVCTAEVPIGLQIAVKVLFTSIKNLKFFKIFRHIESLDAYVEY